MAPSSIIIRNARVGDGAAIARLFVESAAFYLSLAPDAFRLPDEDGLVEFVEPGDDTNNETSLGLVAIVEQEIAGYIEAQITAPTPTARFQIVPFLAHPRLWINSVSTSQKFWRRGVATALVEAAEAWGKDRGAVLAMCDTWLGSPMSVPFWEQRMGYERRAVILQKPLS